MNSNNKIWMHCANMSWHHLPISAAVLMSPEQLAAGWCQELLNQRGFQHGGVRKHSIRCESRSITNQFKLTQIAEIWEEAACPLSRVAGQDFSETHSFFLSVLDETTRNVGYVARQTSCHSHTVQRSGHPHGTKTWRRPSPSTPHFLRSPLETFVSRREGHEKALFSKHSATLKTTVCDARPLKKVSLQSMEKRLVVRRMTCVTHTSAFAKSAAAPISGGQRRLNVLSMMKSISRETPCSTSKHLHMENHPAASKQEKHLCASPEDEVYIDHVRMVVRAKVDSSNNKKQRIMSRSCTCGVGIQKHNQKLPAPLCLWLVRLFDVAPFQNMRQCHEMRSTS